MWWIIIAWIAAGIASFAFFMQHLTDKKKDIKVCHLLSVIFFLILGPGLFAFDVTWFVLDKLKPILDKTVISNK